MTACTSAAVIGLGLIGGSVSRDLAARGVRVRAYDANADHLASALRDGVVHEALDWTLAGVAGAEVVVIAVPVDAAIEILGRLEPFTSDARLITDVGSTKARIVASANDLQLGARFVGSHPMAGGHRSGWDASSAGLFDGAPVYLCPTSCASEDTRSLADAFWRDLGARPICMDAERHDNQLAWTSHLPHIVSTALALTLAQANVGRRDLERRRKRAPGPAPQQVIGGPLGQPVFGALLQGVERARGHEPTAQAVIAFLHRGKDPGEALGEIGSTGRPRDAAVSCGCAHGREGANGQTDFELAARQALFVQSEYHTAINDQGSPGIVAIPHSDYGFVGFAHAAGGAGRFLDRQSPATRCQP